MVENQLTVCFRLSWLRVTLLSVGAMLPFAGSVPPPGFLICDGQTFSQSHPHYARLFAVIGTAYTSPSNVAASLFSVPEMRGNTAVGSNPGAANPTNPAVPHGSILGKKNQQLDLSHVPSHSHSGTTAGSDRSLNHAHGINYNADFLQAEGGEGFQGWGFLGNSGGRMNFGTYPSGYPWGHDVGFHGHEAVNLDHLHTFTTNGGNGIPGAPTPFSLYQPSVGVNYIIKYADL